MISENAIKAAARALFWANYTQAQVDDEPAWYVEATAPDGFAWEEARVALLAASVEIPCPADIEYVHTEHPDDCACGGSGVLRVLLPEVVGE